MPIPLSGPGYIIRFARRLNSGINGANVPIAVTAQSWDDYLAQIETDPDDPCPLITTTGQVVWVQAADCGADCKCALEWWEEKD
jgi:hypothetical protein